MSKFKVVPMEPTAEMVAALRARLTTTSRGGILNAGNALADAISAAPAAQREPTDSELLAFAEEENFFLFCDDDDFLQIARAVMHRYVGMAPQIADNNKTT